MLSGVVHHYMKADAKVTIGRKDADPKPDVALTGLGVQKNHAVITCEESVFKIEPGQSNAKVKVNGKPISSGIVSIIDQLISLRPSVRRWRFILCDLN